MFSRSSEKFLERFSAIWVEKLVHHGEERRPDNNKLISLGIRDGKFLFCSFNLLYSILERSTKCPGLWYALGEPGCLRISKIWKTWKSQEISSEKVKKLRKIGSKVRKFFSKQYKNYWLIFEQNKAQKNSFFIALGIWQILVMGFPNFVWVKSGIFFGNRVDTLRTPYLNMSLRSESSIWGTISKLKPAESQRKSWFSASAKLLLCIDPNWKSESW